MNVRKLGVGVVTTAVFAAGLWAGIGTAGWSGESQATALKAALAAGKEVPKPEGVKPGATGIFSAGLTRRGTGGTLSWRLTFRNLTGAAAAAHIHLGKAGVAGPVAVGLCGPCKSGAKGTARISGRVVTALLGRGAYVNVHTAKNPAGEIRGQVTKGGTAPPPGTGTTGTGTTTTEPPTYPTDPYP
jgi:CHRD domain